MTIDFVGIDTSPQFHLVFRTALACLEIFLKIFREKFALRHFLPIFAIPFGKNMVS